MNHSPTYAYRFADENAAIDALKKAFGEQNGTYRNPDDIAIDNFGMLRNDETGELYEGWHINTSAEITVLAPYRVQPKTMLRVFA